MKTVWTLQELNAYTDEPLKISGQMDVKEALTSRSDRILDAEDLTVDGFISVNPGEYLLFMTLDIDLVLPSTRSLEPVEVHLNIPVTELYLPSGNRDRLSEIEDEVAIVLEDDSLDLREAIIENILLSLPSQVLTDEEKTNQEMPQGKNWKVIREDDLATFNKEANTGENSPFSALKDLFPDESSEEEEE